MFFKDILGHIDLIENQGGKGCFNTKLRKVVNNMKRIYVLKWQKELNRKSNCSKTGGNKLRTYNTFKQKFQYETYLDTLGAYENRKNITKLRISAHKLEIETGRYTSKKHGKRIEEKDRLCKFCDANKIEDEFHVIMCCSNYEIGRSIMFNSLRDTFPHFEKLNECEQFIFIMECLDYETSTSLSNMIGYIIQTRGNF